MNQDKRYPLCWPAFWPRTVFHRIRFSAFRVSQNSAQSNLFHQLSLLGAKEIILSTNIKLRNDGLPYASQRDPEDKGVAIYFKYKKKDMVFACDNYKTIGDNIHAVGKTIEALRGIERWGASDMLERAFTGFEALPNPDVMAEPHWRDVLDYYGNDLDIARKSFKAKRSKAHSDNGGSDEEFIILNKAWAQCKIELE